MHPSRYLVRPRPRPSPTSSPRSRRMLCSRRQCSRSSSSLHLSRFPYDPHPTSTIIEEGEIKEVELVKKEDFRRQWQVASQIFPSAESNRKRVHFLKYDSVFRDCMSTLSLQLAGISDLLRQIREQLISCYTLAEASYPHISEDAFKIEKLTAFSRLFAKAFMEAKQFTLRDFPDEWIREYFKSLEDESPSNAEQRSTTSVKRELDDPFVDGRTSKSQK